MAYLYDHRDVQAGDDVFYSKGRHALKFGILFNRFNQGSALANAGNNSVSGEVQWGGQDFLLAGIAFPFWDARTLTSQTDTFFIYNHDWALCAG